MSRNRSPRRPIIALLTAACLFTFFLGVALAANYLGAGSFPTGSLKWQFDGTASDSGGSYTDPAANGMSSWTAATNLNLTQVTDGTWDIDVNVADYGATGWTGYTYICSTNGSCDNQTAWDGTFSWAETRINTNLLVSNTQDERQNTMMHEAGHAFSLAHRDDSTSIMQPFQTSITTPNQTDIDLINARY
ncbi:MAG: matrixin family metalloprotease [Acidobacteriota bacterium]|nr:matrixin family metalloprotease [Acidobacteriota bacterium]